MLRSICCSTTAFLLFDSSRRLKSVLFKRFGMIRKSGKSRKVRKAEESHTWTGVTNTGNGERGTGNGEPGTGVWERVYSGNPYENSKWRTKSRKRVWKLILSTRSASMDDRFRIHRGQTSEDVFVFLFREKSFTLTWKHQ